MSRPVAIDGQEIALSTSVGISLFPKDGHDRESLVRSADQAMYQAKNKGRCSFHFFSEELNFDCAPLGSLLSELAVALDEGQFELLYQPEVALATGEVVAMEALVRWHHPQQGLLLPDAFLPLIETTELMDRLTDWVVEAAFRQAKAWQEAGHPVRVEVNLSSNELMRTDLADRRSLRFD